MEPQVIKSPNDDKEYKILKLQNGLETMLISDKNTKLSYVSMVINAGSIYETDTLGLAHFLEHMLFHGNKKYPESKKYFEFINSHGGKTNAFTMSTKTCYYFSIDNEYINESLDMFAHFFIDPLFDEHMINKEINAIDAEYYKDIGIDGFQIKQTLKLITQENHPFKNFSIGCHETLDKKNIRDELIKFYNKYYVSNNMKLIIVNNKPIEKMIELTNVFLEINKSPNILQPSLFGYPLTSGNIIKFVPTSSSHTLILLWSLPYYFDYENYKIIKYIFYLLGRESTGSIAHILINNSLIDDLSVHTIENFGDYIIVGIGIQLTSYGYSNIDVVISIVMYYLNTLKQLGFNRKNFDLFSKCTKLNFLFEEETYMDDQMRHILSNICTYYSPLHTAISRNSLVCNYDEHVLSIYNKYMKYLSDEKLNIILGSPKCLISSNQQDKWFQFPYCIEKININKNLKFMFNDIYHFNKTFVPSKLIIYKNKEEFKQPVKLNFPYEVWFNYENSHKHFAPMPKVCVVIEIKLPFMYTDIKEYISANIFINMVNRKLRGVLYDSILCKTRYSIYIHRDELIVEIYGFNDKIEKILECIVDSLCDSSLDNIIFNREKDKYLNYLEDTLLEPPFENLSEMLSETFYIKHYSLTEQLKHVNGITLDDIKKINIINNNGIKCLVNGNMTKKRVIYMCGLLYKLYTPTKIIIDNYQLKPTVNKQIYFKNKNKNDTNTFGAIVICTEKVNIINKLNNLNKTEQENTNVFMTCLAFNMLLQKILSDKFFSLLRTQKQLGYIVKSNFDISDGLTPMLFQVYYVQSSKYSPTELTKHIEQFFVDMKTYINNITFDELQNYINACVVNLSVVENNIYDRTIKIFKAITMGTYDFEYNKTLSNEIIKITPETLNIFYEKYFSGMTSKKIFILRD